MSARTVWFWRDMFPLLRGLARCTGVSVNRLVNLAVAQFVGACDEEPLRLQAKLLKLVKEENELRRVSRVMLRSGSFLPQYADRLLRPIDSPLRKGQVPLRALSAKEEEVMRRVLHRREAIAGEIAEVLDRLLPKKKFQLSRVRRRTRDTSVKNVRTGRSDL